MSDGRLSGCPFCVPENNALGIPNEVHGTAVDGGVKVDFAGFEGVVYGYYGKGVGTTGLYILAVSAGGQERESNGGYVQLTYKIDRLKIGASYGISQLKLADDEQIYGVTGTGAPTGLPASDLVSKNESGVFGLYYSLTKSLTLVGEFIDTRIQGVERQRGARKGRRSRRHPVLLIRSGPGPGTAPCDWSKLAGMRRAAAAIAFRRAWAAACGAVLLVAAGACARRRSTTLGRDVGFPACEVLRRQAHGAGR